MTNTADRISVADAAQILGVSAPTVRAMVREGNLRAIRFREAANSPYYLSREQVEHVAEHGVQVA